MQLVHLPSVRVVSGQQICAGRDPELGDTFACSVFSEAGMSLVTTAGSLHSFSNIDLATLDAAVTGGEVERVRAVQSGIVATTTTLGDTGLVADCALLSNTQLLLATERGVVRDLASHDYLALPGCVKLVTSRTDPTLLLCLDREGSISVLCHLTMVRIFTWKLTSRSSSAEVVEDMVILEDEGSTDIKLLVFTSDSIREENFLLLLDFPSFSVSYRLAVSWFTKLVTPHLSQETPLVMEGTAENVLRPDIVTRIKMRGICEGVPEQRLQRLLKRLKFDEAEKFAASFKLPLEPVHQARAAHLLTFLSPWKAPDPARPHAAVMAELEATLTKMTDLNFVVELCVTAAAPSLAMTRDLLNFARRKIENNPGSVSEQLLLRVGRTLHRLETFVLVHPDPGDLVDTVDTWMEFTRAAMLGQVETLLARGDLERALLVWIRHQAEFRAELGAGAVRALLQLIPDTVSGPRLLAWLAQFIPDCLELVPDSLPAICSWAVAAVTSLELARRATWPQSGLALARAVLDTMTFRRTQAGASDFSQFMSLLTLNQQRIEQDSPLSQLINLIKALEDLLLLHKKFRIKIKLSEFTDPVKFNVVSLILDWVNSSSEIRTLMDTFLTSFLLRAELDINKTLSEYIVSILDNTSFTWHWHIGAAPWEEKVATLVQYITNVEDKSEVILEAVKNAPVPWSEVISGLCEAGAKLQHRNSVLIQEQESLVKVKTILRKYDCKSYMTSGRQADRLLVVLMRKGGEEGFRDALDICSVVGGKTELEMEKLYMQHLLEDKQDAASVIKRVQGHLKSSPEIGVEFCRFIVDTAKMIVKMEVGDQVEASYMEAVKAVMASLVSLKRPGDLSVSDIVEKAELLIRTKSLKTEFGLLTSETSFAATSGSITDKMVCRKLMWKFLEVEVAAFKESEVSGVDNEDMKVKDETDKCGMDDKVKTVYNKIKRVCDLLGLEQDEAMAGLVLRLEMLGLVEAALLVADIIKTQDTISAQLAETFYSVLYRLAGSGGRGGGGGGARLAGVAGGMMSQALTFCSGPSLADTVELAAWAGLETRILQESSDQAAFSQPSQQPAATASPYSDWRFTHFYSDRGLPLDPGPLLPLTQVV